MPQAPKGGWVAMLGVGLPLGILLLALVLLAPALMNRGEPRASAQPQPTPQPRLEAGQPVNAATPPAAARAAALAESRIAALEARLAALETPTPAAAPAAPGQEVAAWLMLNAAISTARPWQREWALVRRLAGPGGVPAPLADVLDSHAARGVPTLATLRERFEALLPDLASRLPRQGGFFSRGFGAAQGLLAGIGLVPPPDADPGVVALDRIGRHLRQEQLAGAVADAMTLDPALGPLLAGWLAQAQARLAVEQAVAESLHQILGGAPGSGR